MTGARTLTMSLLAMTVCVAAHGQARVVYVEGFDSFSGPSDLDDGTFRVQWCTSDAVVTGNSFCMTGNALRLDSPATDPMVRVHVGNSGCDQVTLQFDYSQFAATGSILWAGVSLDDTSDCDASPIDPVATMDVSGGVCVSVTSTVTVGTADSVYWRVDHGLVGGALLLDSVVISVDGCPTGGHECCETGSAGCIDDDVEACVCKQDSFCCDVEWDDICVDEVERLGCGLCNVSTCVTSFDADFGTVFLPGGLCPNLPGLFESCEGDGPYLTTGTACGGSGDAAMRFGGGFPYSSATTPCLDFSESDAPAVTFVYTKISGTLGPKLEISIGGDLFQTLWSAPVLPPDGCLSESVDLSIAGGMPNVRLRFSSGSSVTNGAAFDDIHVALDPQHACCDIGGPGCVDPIVRDCVCELDPFCCEDAWDDVCVTEVELLQCGDCPGAGDATGDGVVDVQDLLSVILQWGVCSPLGPCSGDVSGDGLVDIVDLLLVLLNWG